MHYLNDMLFEGSTKKPSTLRSQEYECPFPDSEVQSFSNGILLMAGLGSIIFLITSFITYYISRKFFNLELPLLDTEREIYINDIVVLLTIFIEML